MANDNQNGNGNLYDDDNLYEDTNQFGQETKVEAHHTATNTISEDKNKLKYAVQPHLNDTKTPIVFFVGPAASGKSMILVRLSKYLRNIEKCIIETDDTFLNTNEYQNDCKEFNECLDTDIALDGTVKYLLVSVKDSNKRKICQFLEAPGEDYFDPLLPNKEIPGYMKNLIASPNKKVFVFLLDLDSKVSLRRDIKVREKYSRRLETIYNNLFERSRDRLILLYNKIDIPGYGTIHQPTQPDEAEKEVRMLYQQGQCNLFSTCRRPFLGGLFQVDNFEFRTFCTGLYSDQTDDKGNPYQTYNISGDVYPRDLWNEIIRRF